MAVTNGDIKSVAKFAFQKYFDLMNWFEKKTPGISQQDMKNARGLLLGLHFVKVGEEVHSAVHWESGRNRIRPYISISNAWVSNVEKEMKKRGIIPVDLQNSILNQGQVENEIGKKSDKYKYMKNTVNEMSQLIESSTPEEAIAKLTESRIMTEKDLKEAADKIMKGYSDEELKTKIGECDDEDKSDRLYKESLLKEQKRRA